MQIWRKDDKSVVYAPQITGRSIQLYIYVHTFAKQYEVVDTQALPFISNFWLLDCNGIENIIATASVLIIISSYVNHLKRENVKKYFH